MWDGSAELVGTGHVDSQLSAWPEHRLMTIIVGRHRLGYRLGQRFSAVTTR